MTPREMVILLKKNGFAEIRQKGSHIFLERKSYGEIILSRNIS